RGQGEGWYGTSRCRRPRALRANPHPDPLPHAGEGPCAAGTASRRKTMDYRLLGRSGLKVSPICLGTMMFGGRTDVPTSERIIAKARDAGINFIDTAD